MKRLLTLTIILIQFLFVSGQVKNDFSKGYIIKNNNDTVAGDIKSDPYSVMSSKIQFKGFGDSDFTSFTPDELLGCHSQSSTYFESIKIKSLNRKDTIIRNYFALKIISGKIDFLIVYFPDGSEKYFVRNKLLGLSELEQLSEINLSDNENPGGISGIQKSTSNKYIITLAKYMNNSPKYQNRIRNCEFRQRSIMNLISDYNSDFGINLVNQPENKVSWDLSVTAGINYYLDNNLKDGHNSWGIVLGFEAAVYNKEKFLKTEIILGLTYQKYIYSENTTHSQIVDSALNPLAFPTNPPIYEYTYKDVSARFRYSENRIELPIFFRYNNKLKLFSPICELGVKPYLVQSKTELVNYYSVRNNFTVASKLILGIGIGMNYKKVNVKYMFYVNKLEFHSIFIGYKLN